MRQAQLPGSLKQHRRELERCSRDDVAVVGLDGAQKFPELFGVGNGSVVESPQRGLTAGLAVHEVLGRVECSDVHGVQVRVVLGFSETS